MTFSRGEDVLRTATLEAPASSLTLRRAAAVVLGTALVTAAARITLPLPGTPVPFTLQPLAVLIVGGLLGPWLGAASLVLYLALGAAQAVKPTGLFGSASQCGLRSGMPLAKYVSERPCAWYHRSGLLE